MSPRLSLTLLVACGSADPVPADHVCLDLDAGSFVTLAEPTEVFGVGLSYAEHLRETGQSADTTPPVFRKTWTPTISEVPLPSHDAMVAQMERTEPGLTAAVQKRELAVTPLLDWEVELGMVLLEDQAPGRAPKVGFFVANDLSERSLAVLGEGQSDRYAYWGASKSHPGFVPASTRAWVPDEPVDNGIPCVTLRTRVNGEVRQEASTADLVLTSSALLETVAAYRGEPLAAGTWVLTGTPSGVALATPAWKVQLANLVGLDRFTRLSIVQGRAEDFLAAGDVVQVEAEGLGEVVSTIVTERPAL